MYGEAFVKGIRPMDREEEKKIERRCWRDCRIITIIGLVVLFTVYSAIFYKAQAEPMVVYSSYKSTPIPSYTKPRKGIRTVKRGVEAFYDNKKYKFSTEWKQSSLNPSSGIVCVRFKVRF